MIALELDTAALEKALGAWSAELQETNKQATMRVAVGFARQAAVQTEPAGSGSEPKEKMHARIEAGMRRAFYVIMKKTVFNRILREAAMRGGNPRLTTAFLGRTYEMEPHYFIDDFDAAWRWIERIRDNRGHPRRKKSIYQKRIIPLSLFRKVLVKRRRLAGIAKGGWIGAAEAIQRGVRWEGSRPIGKNFLNWARKHRHFGRGRHFPRAAGGYEVELEHTAYHIRNAFREGMSRSYFEYSWARVIKWYARALSRIDKRDAA